jgi:hypothetical protein
LQNNDPDDEPEFGDQTPRILHSPDAPTSAGPEAIALAAEFGLYLDPWQQLVLHEALKERADGRWAAFEVGLMVSRQNGKGSILEAIELSGLFLFGERLIIHSAHQFRTSKEAMRRLEFLLHGSNHKYKLNRSHGEESLELLSGPNKGARVMFQTRTKSGGLGLSGDRVILDEAMLISSEAIQALMPTLSARPNPQIWYTGSAVDQRIHANCEVFTGVRQRALANNGPRLCYMEWSCEDDADPTSLRERARANPGKGYRITDEYIEDEFNSFLGMGDVRAFGVQRLGIGDWPELGDARSEIPAETWRDMGTSEPELVGRTVIGVCRAPEGGPWAIAAAQRTADGRIHLEVGYTGTESADDVLDMVVETVAAWDPAALVLGSAAVDIMPELEVAGVEAVKPTRGEEAQACGGFLNDALAVAKPPILSHGNQTTLNNAAKRAIKHPIAGGGFVWGPVDGSAYAQLTAVTLARWGLLKFSTAPIDPTVHEWPSDAEIKSWLKEVDDDDDFADSRTAYWTEEESEFEKAQRRVSEQPKRPSGSRQS